MDFINYKKFFNEANRFPLTKAIYEIRDSIFKKRQGYMQAIVAPPFGATPTNTSEWQIRAAEDEAIANQLQITALQHELKELETYLQLPADYEKTLSAEMQARKLAIESYLKQQL